MRRSGHPVLLVLLLASVVGLQGERERGAS
jgi:hypothetical protein